MNNEYELNRINEEELSQTAGGFIVHVNGKFLVKDDRNTAVLGEFWSLSEAEEFAKANGVSIKLRSAPGVIMV